jgi:hypothetical protein
MIRYYYRLPRFSPGRFERTLAPLPGISVVGLRLVELAREADCDTEVINGLGDLTDDGRLTHVRCGLWVISLPGMAVISEIQTGPEEPHGAFGIDYRIGDLPQFLVSRKSPP